jgi:uroporphyrinogen decarboxylase
MSVNHRERVIAAIHHQEADRVPVDLGGMRSTTMLGLAYARLKEYLGIVEGDVTIFDPYLQLAYIEEPVRRRFGCDVVILNDSLLGGWRPYHLPDGTPALTCANFRTEPDGRGGEYSLDGSGRRTWYRPAGGYYFDPVYFPLAAAQCEADLAAYTWNVIDEATLRRLQDEARRLSTETDYAIMASTGGSFLEAGGWLCGFEKWMMDLAGNRPFAEALLDRVLENHLRNAELVLQAVGDYVQIIEMDDDLGAQAGPQIHPRMYNEMIQPRQKVLWSRIHALRPQVSVFLHSCGAIFDLIPGLIDAGLDILNPVQISARGMQPERLKSEFGERLCLWGGGCDTQHVLPFGTPQEVYEHTRHNVEVFKPGGGYVFSQVHNIQANVPPENVVAMFEAVRDAGKY